MNAVIDFQLETPAHQARPLAARVIIHFNELSSSTDN